MDVPLRDIHQASYSFNCHQFYIAFASNRL